MKILIFFSLFFIAVYLGYASYARITSLKMYSWMKNEIDSSTQKIDNIKDYVPIILIIPGLRETSIAKETIEYFDLLEYPPEHLHVIFATVDEKKEKKDRVSKINAFYKKLCRKCNLRKIAVYNNGLFERTTFSTVADIIENTMSKEDAIRKLVQLYYATDTTYERINKILQSKNCNKNFYNIKCPNCDYSGKPTQINYVLSLIEKSGLLSDKEVYIGVYDFDSRPDIRTLKYLNFKYQQAKKSGARSPDFFQQMQYPLNAIGGVQVFSRWESLTLSNLTLYMRRVLAIELFKFRRYEIMRQKGGVLPCVNCLGSGMFILFNVLIDLGKFCEPVEDLILGYQLSSCSKEMQTIPFLNLTEPYYNICAMMNSHSRIFMEDIHMVSRKNKFLHARAVAFQEFFEFMIWLFITPVLLTSFLFLFSKTYLALILLLYTIVSRFYIDELIFIFLIPKLINLHKINDSHYSIPRFTKILMVLQSPLMGIFRFISALWGIIKFIDLYILGNKRHRTKTER